MASPFGADTPLVCAETGGSVRGLPDCPSPVVALLFSASWCPACARFEPLFADFCEDLEDGALQVVLVSRDKSDVDMQAALRAAHVPPGWLALDHRERDLARRLELALGVTTVPSLAVLRRADGAIVSPIAQARREVVKGPPSAVCAQWSAKAVSGTEELAALPPLESVVEPEAAAPAA